MMPRGHPDSTNRRDSNSHSNNSNINNANNPSSISAGGMNVNLNGNMNYSGTRGSGGSSGNSSAGTSSNRAGEVRQRYAHHGGDTGSSSQSGGAAGGGGGGMPAGFGGAMGAAAAAMGDYGGLANQYGLAGLGPFNPGAGGMNAAAMNGMNPASLYPHLGAAGIAAHHQSPQAQQAAAALGDFGGGSGAGGASNAMAGTPGGGSNPQSEQEEELLLNILIARRQRQHLGPGGGGGQASNSTSWADDFVRLRDKTMNPQQQDSMGGSASVAAASGERMPFDGMGNSLQQQQQGDTGSHRSHSTGRMSIGAAGMGHSAAAMQGAANMNMNSMNMNSMNMNSMQAMNMNMPPQFLAADPSARLRHRGGGSMGFPMGSPQGAWMGANAAASMQSHQNNAAAAARSENAYNQAQRQQDMGMNMNSMKSNTQLGMDVLERVDRMMPGNMMHDARMAEQGGGGGSAQHPYQNHHFSAAAMAGQHHHHGMGMQDPSAMGYGKRGSLDGQTQQTMNKGAAKLSQHQQMQHMFASPPKAEEPQPVKKKRLHKRKPADMPRRPLSAYNLFFSEERERILREINGKTEDEDGADKDKDESKPKALLRPLLPSEKKRRPHRKTHGKISFQLLAQKVGQRWKALPDDQRKYYQDLAQEDMKRQKKAMEEYYQKRAGISESDAAAKEAHEG